MSTVSVVVPSLNDARMLEGCLAAIATQTRPPDEVIVVDNGSTDDTAAVARAAGAIVVHEPVRGVLSATAAGFDAATGDVIGRLDADSRPAPDWVARIAERFDADPTLTALTGGAHFYGKGPVLRWVGRHIYIGGYLFVFRAVIAHMPVFGSNFALRRDAWLGIRDRVHRSDPKAHDDLDISLVLDPGAGFDYDPGLHVDVSARPFDNFAGFLRRASWAFHIVSVNFRELGWPRRVWRGFRGRARRRAAQRELARGDTRRTRPGAESMADDPTLGDPGLPDGAPP